MLTLADVALVTAEVALSWLVCIAIVVAVSMWYGDEK